MDEPGIWTGYAALTQALRQRTFLPSAMCISYILYLGNRINIQINSLVLDGWHIDMAATLAWEYQLGAIGFGLCISSRARRLKSDEEPARSCSHTSDGQNMEVQESDDPQLDT